MDERGLLEEIWWAGVNSVAGYESVRKALSRNSEFSPTHIVAVGKGASSMARAALDGLGQELPCLVVTKYAHGESELSDYENLQLIESGHPVPDENSLRAGRKLIEFVDDMGKEASLLMLVSGGASALAEDLEDDMTLDELQALNEQMLADGLDIHAINKKRKQFSQIKAGKLLARFKGQSAIIFAISDVEGDDIAVIGSGLGQVPRKRVCKKMKAQVIASNSIARTACQLQAEKLDLPIIANDETLYGDIIDIATDCATKVKKGRKGLYIFGGEPTTILPKNPGEGGRNQALAVIMARELSGENNISILVAGTDGSDGPTNSAGGFVTSKDWKKYSGGATALRKADSGAWLRKAGGLFETGPTGTNVMDIMLVFKS